MQPTCLPNLVVWTVLSRSTPRVGLSGWLNHGNNPRARSPPSSLTTALSSFTILSLIIATNFRTTSRNGKGVARLPEPSCWIKDQSCDLADFQLALGILGFARHATRTTKEW